MHKDFIYLDEVVPNMRWDAKYATWDNFMGHPADGYENNRIAATLDLALALRQAAMDAAKAGYGLLVWDAYRPQRAVDHFIKWASLPEDGKTKRKHYPNIEKKDMIKQGYVAKKSSHSRGSAIDLTLYQLSTREQLAMGGGFDYMDPKSHHGAFGITKEEERNRELLRSFMEENGFTHYEYEWWHYMLESEPFPNTYFDFVA